VRNWSCFQPSNWTLAEDRSSAMMTVLNKPGASERR
jgi:flagellar motor protein MotB